MQEKLQKKSIIKIIAFAVTVLSIILGLFVVSKIQTRNVAEGINKTGLKAEEPTELAATSVTTVPPGYTGIYTVEDLQAISNNPDGTYILMADIEVGDHTPIGTEAKPFTGYFEGNYHTLSNITINTSSETEEYYGIFGYADGAEFYNLTIDNITVSDTENTSYVGGLVGYVDGMDTIITGVKANVNFTSVTSRAPTHMGGIAGYIVCTSSLAKVTDCIATGVINSNGDQKAYLGGIVGYVSSTYSSSSLQIAGCSVKNMELNLNAAPTTLNRCFVGGVIGYLTTGGLEIDTTYTTGEINVDRNSQNYVGGIIGQLSFPTKSNGSTNLGADISDSYSKMNITETSNAEKGTIGGIVGRTDPIKQVTKITNCYAAGRITADTYEAIGGLSTTTVVAKRSFWSPEYIGTYSDIVNNGSESTKANMVQQSTYAGWDFTDIWLMPHEGVEPPILQKAAEYRVDYYIQKDTMDGYILADSAILGGVAETTANAEIKTFGGYKVDESIPGTKLSGIIKEDELLVLSVYYDIVGIEVRKYEKGTTTPIQGVEFVLIDSDKNIVNNALGDPCRVLSDENGLVSFKKVNPGIYFLKESKTLPNYELSKTEYKITVGSDNTITYEGIPDRIVYNEKVIEISTGMIRVVKYEQGTTTAIPNAVIGFYEEDGDPILDGNDAAVELTTNSRGEVDLSDEIITLKPGRYYYKEITAPSGYILNPNSYYFTLNSDETVTYEDQESNEKGLGVLYNESKMKNITVTVKWEDNNNEKGKRPTSVIVKVLNGTSVVDQATVTSADNWQHTFSVEKLDKSNNPIQYTVDEEEVVQHDLHYYQKQINEYEIINTYELPTETPYKIEYYKQKDDLSGYVVSETENKTGTTDEVVRIPDGKEYEGYIFNPDAQGTKLEGTILKDGSLILKAYFDKIKESELMNVIKIENVWLEQETEKIEGSKFKTEQESRTLDEDVTSNIGIVELDLEAHQKNVTRKYKIKNTEMADKRYKLAGDIEIEIDYNISATMEEVRIISGGTVGRKSCCRDRYNRAI